MIITSRLPERRTVASSRRLISRGILVLPGEKGDAPLQDVPNGDISQSLLISHIGRPIYYHSHYRTFAWIY